MSDTTSGEQPKIEQQALEKAELGQQAEVSPRAKPVAGTSIPGSTTLTTLFNTCFTNQSAQHGTPTFQWSGPNEIIANFTSATTQNASSSAMYIRFEARAFWPAVIS
jgi:hypothetical protein